MFFFLPSFFLSGSFLLKGSSKMGPRTKKPKNKTNSSRENNWQPDWIIERRQRANVMGWALKRKTNVFPIWYIKWHVIWSRAAIKRVENQVCFLVLVCFLFPIGGMEYEGRGRRGIFEGYLVSSSFLTSTHGWRWLCVVMFPSSS